MLQVYILLVLLHKLILQLKLERPVAPATLPGYTTGWLDSYVTGLVTNVKTFCKQISW